MSRGNMKYIKDRLESLGAQRCFEPSGSQTTLNIISRAINKIVASMAGDTEGITIDAAVESFANALKDAVGENRILRNIDANNTASVMELVQDIDANASLDEALQDFCTGLVDMLGGDADSFAGDPSDGLDDELDDDGGSSNKPREAFIRAQTILNRYTMPRDIEQVSEAEAVIRKILGLSSEAVDWHVRGGGTPDSGKIAQLKQQLLSGSVQKNSDAVKAILVLFTSKHSYVVEDSRNHVRSQLNATHMRRVNDIDDTVDGGILMPASTNVDISRVLWDRSVLTDFGKTIPVLNTGTMEMQILLNPEVQFSEKAACVMMLRKQLAEAGIGKLKIFDALNSYGKAKKKHPVLLSPLAIPATDRFMKSVSGDEFDVVALSTTDPKKSSVVEGLSIDFISHMYRTLSPATGASVYVNKSTTIKNFAETLAGLAAGEEAVEGDGEGAGNGADVTYRYESARELKADIERHGHPSFYLLVPNSTIRFTRIVDESFASTLLGVFNRAIHLVGASIDGHECILVLTDKLARALFNI